MIICKICKGKKIIYNENTKKNDICPKCQGSGQILENKENNKKLILG